MTGTDELRAALAVAELEDELAAAKASGDVPPGLKADVREARRAYRAQRSTTPGEGDGAASPGAAHIAAEVQR